MEQLKIEYLPISELKAYVNNAKEHPAEQVEQIKKSILEFGMNDPIAVWKDNEIVEGHGRLLACAELGEPYDVVPVIRLDHLSDEERKAYALVHNKLTMNSDFNMELLNMELEELKELDMEQFGFDLAIEDTDGDIEAVEDTDTHFNYQEQYGVIVMCESESEQEKVYTRLTEEGYECKVVAV